MQTLVEKLLMRWGTDMVLVQEGREIPFRGLLQHSGSKSRQNTQREFSPLGQVPDGEYAFFGPGGLSVAEGDILLLQGKCYELRRLEQVMLRNKPLYTWGLCVQKGGGSV